MAEISITIIIPVYNVASYVEECIRSIMRQTYDGPMECIIVDDCGADQSMAIVEKMIANYHGPISFIVMHHDRNRGLSAARNTGIKQASGEFLMFVDSDDQVHDDFCKDALNCAEHYHADLVMFSHVRINKEGEKELSREFRYSTNGMKTQNELLDMIFEDEGTATWNKLYRKKLFDEISFPDGFLYEDEGTIYKLIMKASCIYYLDEVLYYHYFRPGSITTLRNQKRLDDRASLNLQRYIDLNAWGYHSDILERRIREFGLRYLIRKRRDLSNSDYIRYSQIIRDTKHIPHGYPSKQLFYIYLLKYCPWLFEWYFTIKGGKDMNYTMIPKKVITGYNYLIRGQFYEFFRFTWHYIYAITHFSTKGNIIMETPTQALDTKGLKIAVYTCIVGNYDRLLEPQYVEPGIDYYVFTDIDCPASSVWKKVDIRQFEEYGSLTPSQLNRKIKMLPSIYLPGYDYSVYVDGNIEITDAITPMIKEMGTCAFGVHYHRTRDCIYDELVRVEYLGKADITMARRQIADYKKQGYPRHYGLYENTILIRQHDDLATRQLMEAWWEEYQKYPTRDQLSLPFLIWKLGYDKKKIHILGMNLYHNHHFKKISSH